VSLRAGPSAAARDACAFSSGAIHFNNVEELEAGASCVIRDTDSNGPDLGVRRQGNYFQFNTDGYETCGFKLKF